MIAVAGGKRGLKRDLKQGLFEPSIQMEKKEMWEGGTFVNNLESLTPIQH